MAIRNKNFSSVHSILLFHFLYSLLWCLSSFSFSHYAHKLRWNLSFILHTLALSLQFSRCSKYFLFIRKKLHIWAEVACNFFFLFFQCNILWRQATIYIYFFILLRDFSRVLLNSLKNFFSIVAEETFLALASSFFFFLVNKLFYIFGSINWVVSSSLIFCH